MTARVIADELSLPLFTVELHSLISKYMGETAGKLRLVFDAMEETRGVYLFDEFDALGGRRDSSTDVGEARRTLNALLQMVERDTSDALVIATTNHAGLLDRALFRRFDSVVEYPMPTPDVARSLMFDRLAALAAATVDWDLVLAAADGLPHAEIARACLQTAKDAVLAGGTVVTTESLTRAVATRQAAGRFATE